jgi:hypothetical protein
MTIATICDESVPWEQICTHWEGWNKGTENFLPYHLVVPIELIVEKFGPYWNEFLEREAEEDGNEPIGIYAELRTAKYPSLEVMLADHPDLFESLVLGGLQTEFVGYLVKAPSVAVNASYFLQSMTSIKVRDMHIVINGNAMKFICARP